MPYAFAECTALSSLDLRGVDAAALADASYAFGECSALATIWADADWTVPEGIVGAQCFYNCSSLVGGAGTAWSAEAVGVEYPRIDDSNAGAAGYLTAG